MRAVQPKWFAIGAMTLMLCLAGLFNSGKAFAESPQSLCVDNEDGTVTDYAKGLMWQKATAGPMNWDAAMSYASGLSLGGHSGWRLPNKDELRGLYHSPCKYTVEVEPARYWSSTTLAGSTGNAWHVVFFGGYVNCSNKSNNYYVRAVRSAQ